MPSDSSAAFAWTIPKPYELSRPAAPLSSAVPVNAFRICWFVLVVLQLQMSAATAETCGVAIDVPSHAS